jgi:rRNA-processing protein Efg1
LIGPFETDSQKAKRRLKQVRKALEAAKEEDKSTLESRVRDADIDYHYALYYPLGKPYVSLFPRKEDRQGAEESDEEASDEKSTRGDPEMRQRIEKAMAEGKASLERLRNELFVEEVLDEDLSVAKEKGPREDNDEEDDDDEDFFE